MRQHHPCRTRRSKYFLQFPSSWRRATHAHFTEWNIVGNTLLSKERQDRSRLYIECAHSILLLRSYLGIKYFPFITIHNWGESPLGRWILRVESRLPQSPAAEQSATDQPTGEISHFGLRIYGSHDVHKKEQRPHTVRDLSYAFAPSKRQLESMFEREQASRSLPNVMQKRAYQQLLDARQVEDNGAMQSRTIFDQFRSIFHF